MSTFRWKIASPAGQTHLAVNPVVAANALDAACRRKPWAPSLCPLDLADDLPVKAFGWSRVAQLSCRMA